MDQVFELFFKYRPFFFRTGEFSFQSAVPAWLWPILLVGVPLLVFLTYRRWRGGGRVGWALIAIRTALFLLLAFVLARPALVLTSLEPKENLLALVIDSSKSMGLPEAQTRLPRGQIAAELLKPESDFSRALDAKFFLRRYGFDRGARRLEPQDSPKWDGDQTNIGAGLETVLAETKNLPMGGVVLFTDGSDTATQRFAEVLGELKARKIPVHTVGVGPESLSQDVEITQVSAARALLPDTVSGARITIKHRGFGGSRGRLEVREGNRLVDSQEIYFPRDSETFAAELSIRPKTEGIKTYEFKVVPLEGEEILENNVRATLIEVVDRRPRILYVEGHPRWEYKFIRQAVRDDQYVRLETLLRTAMNKFYRQGIEEETTLAAGFPNQREVLFEYDAIIFGSVESAFFTYSQMELVRDFVGQRGGGFLMTGGSKSFDVGKYRNTPISEILPVWLSEEESPSGTYAQGQVEVRLSSLGFGHAALQLSPSEADNRKRWSELPPLIDWNVVDRLKAGAVDLVRVDLPGGGRGRDLPLLAVHRFGRGQAMAFLTGSSWHWQMLMEAGDDSHETLWRQILRWLVSTAKTPVTVETDREIYAGGEQVRIRAEVRDKSYVSVNDARISAHILTPSGLSVEAPLQWDPQEEGVYRGVWTPEENGLHAVAVEALERGEDEEVYGTAQSHFVAGGATREYFDPVRKTDFLRKLAQETGGRYYDVSEAAKLPEEIVYTPSTASVTEVRELWDMPINLIFLMALPLLEWILRKKEGAI